MSRRRKLEATNLLNEAKKLDKQGMLKEQITMMKDQNEKNIIFIYIYLLQKNHSQNGWFFLYV